jgi:hypothetical protein
MNFKHSEFIWISFDKVRDVGFAWNQKEVILEFIDAVFGKDLD